MMMENVIWKPEGGSWKLESGRWNEHGS